MNPTGVLFALAMLFTVACHSATTTTGDMVTPEILAAIEREALIVDVRTSARIVLIINTMQCIVNKLEIKKYYLLEVQIL